MNKTGMIVKRILGIICGMVVFLAAAKGLDYLYVPPDSSWMDHWYRILFNSYYDQEHIDNLFVGTSHVHNGVDPYLLDGINGQNNFNMSSPGLRWCDSYYLLKQACEDHDLKHVYLECYYVNLIENPVWEDKTGTYEYVDPMDKEDRITGSWQITYNMRPSLNREAIRYYSAKNGKLVESILPFTRYRMYMTDWDRTISIMSYKEDRAYLQERDYIIPSMTDGDDELAHLGKGCLRDGVRTLYDNNKIYEPEAYIASGYGAGSIKFLRKSIEYCQAKGVDVTLFVVPEYDLQTISAGDYDAFISDMRSLVGEYGIEYYDFNLIKSEYMDTEYEKYYADLGHLNARGAKAFAPVLWDVLSSSHEENAGKFYDSYADKLAAQEPQIAPKPAQAVFFCRARF